MNYKYDYDTYLNFVKTLNRKKGAGLYYENHHIIPKCIGEKNTKENMVLLTVREHFLAHYLLCEIYPENKKLLFAFCGMKRAGKNQKRYFNSRLYQELKIKADEAKSKKVICIETGKIFKSAAFVEKNIINGVRDVIHGKQLTAGGYHWKYYN